MWISPAYAQSVGGDLSGLLAGPLPMIVLMFVVLYFFMIRPQQQRAKQHKALLAALRRGDRIVTAGGIIGTVAKVVNDNEVAVDIAENVRVRVVRSTITQVLAKTEPAAKKETETEDEKGSETAKGK
ncbi:MAG: preprotein translocase subunit YajC [Acidobacteriota bacterium]